MARTATFEPERMDSPEELNDKISQLVRMISSSQHIIAFTGAGISTSAGVPDFRGPEGKWTRQAKGLRPVTGVSTLKAIPTRTHMAIMELLRRGVLKYLVSQNCDGLHRRSGVPASSISELHGNSNVEECESCGQQFFRDFACHRESRGHDHGTGRGCTRCGRGRLLEWTIDFGQQLPSRGLALAYRWAEQSDLCLALGSSLTVSPASDVPEIVARKGRLVVVNLQPTPLTEQAALHIYAPVDVVMDAVMTRLGLPVPPFRLRRRIAVAVRRLGDGETQLRVRGCDSEDPHLHVENVRSVAWGPPAVDLRPLRTLAEQGPWWQPGDEVEVKGDDGRWHAAKVAQRQPNGDWTVSWADERTPSCDVPTAFLRSKTLCKGLRVDTTQPCAVPIRLSFFGHYNEPAVELCSPVLGSEDVEVVHTLEYDLTEGAWHLMSSERCGATDASSGSTTPGNEYGQQHMQYVVEAWMKHKSWSRKHAMAIFEAYCERRRARLDFGPE